MQHIQAERIIEPERYGRYSISRLFPLAAMLFLTSGQSHRFNGNTVHLRLHVQDGTCIEFPSPSREGPGEEAERGDYVPSRPCVRGPMGNMPKFPKKMTISGCLFENRMENYAIIAIAQSFADI